MLIIINPGHSQNGNPDPGAVGNSFKEAIEAKAIADLVKIKFDKLNTGIELKILQQDKGSTSKSQLNNLVTDINSTNADLLLSIHLNSSTNSSAKGIETLYSFASRKGSMFAQCIQNSLTEIPDKLDRGIKSDQRGLAVLKRTKMPACLTEVGFISNKEEANWIHNNSNLISEKLVRGIINYLIDQKVLTEAVLGASESTFDNIKTPKIELIPTENNKYNCKIDGKLILENNNLYTCLNWIKENYVS